MRSIVFILMFLISCFGLEKNIYTPTEIWKIIHEANSSTFVVPIPNDQPHRRVLCSNYGRGCIPGSGKRINLLGVEFIIISFSSSYLAEYEAKSIGQWAIRNWIFDDVASEPIIRNFLQKAFKGQKIVKGNGDATGN